jgi:hypothetical protein
MTRVLATSAGLLSPSTSIELRHYLALYSHTGRPSIDPELMILMLIVGYRFGIRSERRLCEEVQFTAPSCRTFEQVGRRPDHVAPIRPRCSRRASMSSRRKVRRQSSRDRTMASSTQP